MIKIRTSIDQLFDFIEEYSPVKESKIPKQLKNLQTFDKHIKVLENSGMIDVKMPLLSSERIFVFKTSNRTGENSSWASGSLNF
ncbi:MAG: hypothetical protein V1678_02615 [Candidatus Aenigmatarchaeota archaeon]